MKPIKVKEFQDFVNEHQFKRFSNDPFKQLFIITSGLAGETGEVVELLKKSVRDNKEIKDDLLLELGDALHYLTAIGLKYGFGLKEIMAANVNKLKKRHGIK